MQLTRGLIVGAAIDLIERNAAAALTMNELAAELGCGLVPLYSRFPSRDALLDQVTEQVMPGSCASQTPDPGWETFVRGRARALRAAGQDHPQCSVLAATRPTTRPTPHGSGADDLVTLRRAGFSDQDSLWIIRTLRAYVLGTVLLDRGADRLSQEDADAGFEFGLQLFARATAALLSNPA
jgi:AcrR family transcriptional regulator